ncbi:MAG TPA: hypothetical protein VHT24_14480 [Pseudacidobacterium sp.]|jgi:photosystem II stability/assembly factor-like uncharacterized protein|nr:hypothetical protein [Pseudacidobacterium sp.]
MNWCILHLLTVPLIALALPCCAQTGTVTFYSIEAGAAQQYAGALVPFGKAPFTGFLYDGSQQMAHARGGRFVTFRLLAGEHQFSASYRSLDPGDPSVHLNVEDGGQYCVRLSANYKSGSIVMPIAVVHSAVQQVPCDQALKEAGRYKQLELKRIDAPARIRLVSSQTFPRNN